LLYCSTTCPGGHGLTSTLAETGSPFRQVAISGGIGFALPLQLRLKSAIIFNAVYMSLLEPGDPNRTTWGISWEIP
jgi:hypothetical protein